MYVIIRKIIELIGKLISWFGIVPKTRFLSLRDNPLVIQLKNSLESSSWAEAEALLAGLSTDNRYQYVEALVDDKGRSIIYDEWLSSSPESSVANIVSGFQYIHWAWEARGSGTADTVSNAGIRNFYLRLEKAKENFLRAIDLDDNLADPYIGLLVVAMGTGFERENLWNYFTKALVRDKHCYSAHSQMIHAVAEKWGGNPGEIFVIASKAAGTAKSGDPIVGVLAEAHIEQWLYLGMCAKDDEANIYFREPSVRQELIEAYEKIRNLEVSSNTIIAALNNFAFCFYKGGLNQYAKEVLTKLDGAIIEHPWDYDTGSFLSLINTAFLVDDVLQKLDSVKADMPNVVIKRKLRYKDSASNYNESTLIETPEDLTKIRLFKTPIIVPLSILFALLVYVGYPLMKVIGHELDYVEQLKGVAFEVFLFCQMGMISLILLSRRHISGFFNVYTYIDSREALEALKPIVRTNMYTALLALVFLIAGSISTIVILLNSALVYKVIAMVWCIITSLLLSSYNKLENRLKQIECVDQRLEKELEVILTCWLHKALPNF